MCALLHLLLLLRPSTSLRLHARNVSYAIATRSKTVDREIATINRPYDRTGQSLETITRSVVHGEPDGGLIASAVNEQRI